MENISIYILFLIISALFPSLFIKPILDCLRNENEGLREYSEVEMVRHADNSATNQSSTNSENQEE